MAVVIRECVGIERNTFKDAKGVEKTFTRVYALEPFPTDENVVGMKTWDVGTYENVTLKVGDKFKAYFDKRTYRERETGKEIDYPVLAEIVVVKPN